MVPQRRLARSGEEAAQLCISGCQLEVSCRGPGRGEGRWGLGTTPTYSEEDRRPLAGTDGPKVQGQGAAGLVLDLVWLPLATLPGRGIPGQVLAGAGGCWQVLAGAWLGFWSLAAAAPRGEGWGTWPWTEAGLEHGADPALLMKESGPHPTPGSARSGTLLVPPPPLGSRSP